MFNETKLVIRIEPDLASSPPVRVGDFEIWWEPACPSGSLLIRGSGETDGWSIMHPGFSLDGSEWIKYRGWPIEAKCEETHEPFVRTYFFRSVTDQYVEWVDVKAEAEYFGLNGEDIARGSMFIRSRPDGTRELHYDVFVRDESGKLVLDLCKNRVRTTRRWVKLSNHWS